MELKHLTRMALSRVHTFVKAQQSSFVLAHTSQLNIPDRFLIKTDPLFSEQLPQNIEKHPQNVKEVRTPICT